MHSDTEADFNAFTDEDLDLFRRAIATYFPTGLTASLSPSMMFLGLHHWGTAIASLSTRDFSLTEFALMRSGQSHEFDDTAIALIQAAMSLHTNNKKEIAHV